MKLKNRKGSTLALTLMVFAVLMIFATFILSFMVTENKQATHFQNKIQAYYVARSGADTVEAALVKQLSSYSDNDVEQKKFIDLYNSPGKEITVLIDYIDGPILVVNEERNGRRVITIKSNAKYNGVKESVKKILYSTESIITKTENGQFVPAGGELFIYLGDEKPKQIYKNNNSLEYVPDTYVRKANIEEMDQYMQVPLPLIADWSMSNSIVNNGKIISGEYSLDEGVTDIYVNGPLIMEGTIIFNGTVNIYVKETLTIKNNTFITGETVNIAEGKLNKLNFYVYNTNNVDTAIKTDPSSDVKIIGNLRAQVGDIDISVHQEGYIDGHIHYNGVGEVRFSSNSNNFTNNKLLTGSIYAPRGTVSLGIHTSKTANIIGGQIIANTINVYPNNKTQAEKFYTNSTKARINNPIPIDITQNINIKQIGYESFYIDN